MFVWLCFCFIPFFFFNSWVLKQLFLNGFKWICVNILSLEITLKWVKSQTLESTGVMQTRLRFVTTHRPSNIVILFGKIANWKHARGEKFQALKAQWKEWEYNVALPMQMLELLPGRQVPNASSAQSCVVKSSVLPHLLRCHYLLDLVGSRQNSKVSAANVLICDALQEKLLERKELRGVKRWLLLWVVMGSFGWSTCQKLFTLR